MGNKNIMSEKTLMAVVAKTPAGKKRSEGTNVIIERSDYFLEINTLDFEKGHSQFQIIKSEIWLDGQRLHYARPL